MDFGQVSGVAGLDTCLQKPVHLTQLNDKTNNEQLINLGLVALGDNQRFKSSNVCTPTAERATTISMYILLNFW